MYLNLCCSVCDMLFILYIADFLSQTSPLHSAHFQFCVSSSPLGTEGTPELRVVYVEFCTALVICRVHRFSMLKISGCEASAVLDTILAITARVQSHWFKHTLRYNVIWPVRPVPRYFAFCKTVLPNVFQHLSEFWCTSSDSPEAQLLRKSCKSYAPLLFGSGILQHGACTGACIRTQNASTLAALTRQRIADLTMPRAQILRALRRSNCNSGGNGEEAGVLETRSHLVTARGDEECVGGGTVWRHHCRVCGLKPATINADRRP